MSEEKLILEAILYELQIIREFIVTKKLELHEQEEIENKFKNTTKI